MFGAVAVTRMHTVAAPITGGKSGQSIEPTRLSQLMSDPEHPVSRLGLLAYSSPTGAPDGRGGRGGADGHQFLTP